MRMRVWTITVGLMVNYKNIPKNSSVLSRLKPHAPHLISLLSLCTISPLSMRVCVCFNFEDNDTKRQARLWNQVSQRELENLWNQVEKERKKKKSREWESWRNNEKGRLWNQVECKGKKEIMESYGYTCVVDKMQEKKKRKKKETNGWKKGKELEITI